MLIKGNQIHNLLETQPLTKILQQPLQTEDTALIMANLHATSNTAGLPIVAKPVVAITRPKFTSNQQPLKLPTY